jgi:hypothetical protein
MPNISDLEKIIQWIKFSTTVSIPENLYIYLDRWYPYHFIFLSIAILFYRTRFRIRRYIDNDYFPLIPPIIFLVWAGVTVFSIFDFYFSLQYPLPTEKNAITIAIIFFSLAIILFLISLRNNGYISLSDEVEDVSHIIRFFSKVFLLFGSFCFILFLVLAVTSYDENLKFGSVSADISYKYKIGGPSTIHAKIGGPDTGLFVSLLHDDPDSLKPVSSLYLYSNNSNTQFNNTLSGYSLGAGNYYISLNNTTSLPPGSYRLMFESPKYKWINSSKSFFLTQE